MIISQQATTRSAARAIPRRARRSARALLSLLFAAGILAGCAARDPLGVWRRELARYIEVQGGGDPAALRDLPELRSSQSLRPGQVVFGTLDVPGPGPLFFQTYWDLQGVLVGQRTVAGRHWYVFLVGRLARSPDGAIAVDQIQPAAFTVDGDRMRWCAGPADDSAMKRYLSRSMSSIGKALPAFPRTEDSFRLEVRGNQGVITETRSGASWTLRLGGEVQHTSTARKHRAGAPPRS